MYSPTGMDPGATAAIAGKLASNGQGVGVRVFTDNPSPEMRAYVASNKTGFAVGPQAAAQFEAAAMP